MVDSKSVTTVLIIVVCVLVGVFIATLKNHDRLTAREMSVLGFFRGLTLWSAVTSYVFSLVSFLAALALRMEIVSRDEFFAMLGQPIATHLEAWGLLYLSFITFVAASLAMIVMVIVAIEMHLRRIAEKVDRSGYFNN